MIDNEPMAWAVMLADGYHIYDVYSIAEEAKAIDEVVAGNHGVISLYRSPTLTDAEREAIGVAIQCVEAARAQRHPEEEESRDLLWKTTCGLRSLLDRTDRT